MADFSDLHNVDKAPIQSALAFLAHNGLSTKPSDNDQTVRLQAMYFLKEKGVLLEYETRLLVAPTFSEYYLFSNKQISDQLEECGLELTLPFTHLEKTLLLLASNEEKCEYDALIILGEHLTITKFEELIASPFMTQERLHTLSRRVSGWVLDNLRETITAFGFQLPAELILPDDCWLKILQHSSIEVITNFKLVSNNAYRIFSSTEVNTSNFEECIVYNRLDLLRANLKLITYENATALVVLAAKVNKEAFFTLFKRGEEIYNMRDDRTLFRQRAVNAVLEIKDECMLFWVYDHIENYLLYQEQPLGPYLRAIRCLAVKKLCKPQKAAKYDRLAEEKWAVVWEYRCS